MKTERLQPKGIKALFEVGKDRVPLVKSLFNALVRLDTLGMCYKKSEKNWSM
jgi:hypothetical protein